MSKNHYTEDYRPSTQELIDLYEISYTIYNFYEQNYSYTNNDQYADFFDYFGKSLSNLSNTATNELETIILFLCFNYIDVFFEFAKGNLELDIIPLKELTELRFHEDKTKIYLILSISYFQLLKSLHTEFGFHPQKDFEKQFYTRDRIIRYDTFIEKFSRVTISEIINKINN